MATLPMTKQTRIFKTLTNLRLLPKVVVTEPEDGTLSEIWIEHPHEYFPEFRLQWCPGKLHYRVYIYVATTTLQKRNAGYCICVIPNGLAAMGFGALYMFLHKHRANSKSEATE